MTKRKLILLCGVPSSGKTWVCNHLALMAPDKFAWIPHDRFIFGGNLIQALLDNKDIGRTLITECPFGERKMRENLIDAGFDVHPMFIVETPDVISDRYFGREGVLPPENIITRATTIEKRVAEWQAPSGTSLEILDYLLK